MLSVAVMVAGGVVGSLEAFSAPASAAAAPSAAPPAQHTLAIKPKVLWAIEVEGAMLVTSGALRVFLLEGALVDNSPKVDGGALYDAAKKCAAGQGCGRRMSSGERDSLYSFIEQSSWAEGILDRRLVAVLEADGSTIVFTDARGNLADATRLILEGRVCSPQGGGGSQPQCPPGPVPPRDQWLPNLVELGWSL